jgi:hypothetical protein
MKRAGWTLYAVSVVLFLAGGYSKLMGPEHFLFGYTAVSWWRASMALVIYAIGLKILSGETRVAV